MSAITSLKDATEKPDIRHFRVGAQVGEGNFSRIARATYTPTGEVFALKVVEKQRVRRLRIRHANVLNEIAMEKEVLNRLRHPNVVRLFHTFQDAENLYFLLEYLDGGELLDHLVHEGRQIGLHEDLARFYIADAVNAVEYLHANGVLHRDLKPENMVVDRTTSHLKLVDFGTAKNLVDPALNGPNFVGTPEYMAPETIENKDATAASDLWALGCILFQLLTGETPFGAGSAYLTFLKVQNGSFGVPAYVSDSAKDLISKLLQKDPALRPDINEIKQHAFFRGVDFETHMQAPVPSVKFQNVGLVSFAKQLEDAEKARDKELPLAFAASEKAQQRIAALSTHDRSLLMHLLKRKQLLHVPGIYTRFFATVALGRCRYAVNSGYVGLTPDLQNDWADSFSFVVLAGPRLGRAAGHLECDSRGGSTWDTEANAFRRAIADVNKQKPAFVAICGDFVHAEPGQECFDAQVSAFQHLVSEIHADIRLVFVPGRSIYSTSSNAATRDAAYMEAYDASFGDARFSFWFAGMMFIVMNSTLLLHPEAFADQIKQQEDWLATELENGKLRSRGTAVLAFHPFINRAARSGISKSAENNIEAALVVEGISSEICKRHLDLVTQAKASVLVASHAASDVAFDVTTAVNDDNTDSEEEQVGDQRSCKVLCCETPWSAVRSGVHTVTVTQAGLTIERHDPTVAVASPTYVVGSGDGIQADEYEEDKAVPTPEVDATLTLDSVKLDVVA